MTPSEIRALYLREDYARVNPIQVPAPPVRPDPTPSATLRWHLDARGSLVELWRRSWGPLLSSQEEVTEHPLVQHHPGHIAQVYVSTTRPGVVKGWHAHAEQTDRFIAVRGAVLVSLCDLTGPREGWKVQEVVLDSQRSPRVLTIPPGVAHGWMALDHQDGESWVMNLCSREYTGADEFRRPAHAGPAPGVPYQWRQSRDG